MKSMKFLLKILGTISLTSLTTTSVVACKFTESTVQITGFGKQVSDCFQLSDTTAIFQEMTTNQAFLVDSTKITETNKGLTDFGKQVSKFYRISDTIGIFREYSTNQAFLVEYK